MSALSSPDTEKTILGAILLNDDAYFEAAPLLRYEDFSLDSHRRIYARMAAMAGAGKPITVGALIEELETAKELKQVGDTAYVSSLIDGMFSKFREGARPGTQTGSQESLFVSGAEVEVSKSRSEGLTDRKSSM